MTDSLKSKVNLIKGFVYSKNIETLLNSFGLIN